MLACSPPPAKAGMIIKDSLLSPLKIECMLSRGGFSTVYKARNNDNLYVLKRINQKRRFYKLRSLYFKWKNLPKKHFYEKHLTQEKLNETEKHDIELEINALLRAQHKYVVKLFDSFEKMGSFWLVTEFCVCDISDIGIAKHRTPYIPLDVISHLLIPIFEALAHLNSLGYVHLDIKNDNILISSKGVPKLADFGLARECSHKPVKILQTVGTEYYMAPEMVRKEFFNWSIDTWSLAVTWLHAIFGPGYIPDRGQEMPEVFFQKVPPDGSFDLKELLQMFCIPKWRDESYARMFGDSFTLQVEFIRLALKFDWKKRQTPRQMLKLELGKMVLESWEQKNESTLFESSQQRLLQLLQIHMEDMPTESEKDKWSTIGGKKNSTSHKCSIFLGMLNYIST